MRDEEAKVRHAGAGERIDKQGEPEMRREVKAAKTCEEVADNGTPTAGQCKKGKCDTIGSIKVCTDCAFNNEVPINGECKDVTQAPGSTFCTGYAAGLCSACKGASFMFKGGCYEKGNAPGQTMCKTADAGKCTEAAEAKEYFVPPSDTDASHDSVVSCGDTTGVTLNTKTYIGVAGCTTCDKPTVASDNTPKAATCTACGDGKLVKTVDSVTSCIEEAYCNNGYFVDTNGGKKCSACANTCKTCSGAAAQCTSCNANTPYLKKADNSQTGTCVDAAGCTTDNTYYADDTADPTSGKLCRKCAEGGVTVCTKCEKVESGVVCKECTGETAIFGLNKKSCVSQCPENSTKVEDQGKQVCTCNAGFTPNAGSSACVATSSGPNLSTGAIAGISVAAVVVVGGLVGFLCWWFVCRGKA